MSYELTTRAELLSQNVSIEPQLILEIEGIDVIFGAVDILKVARIGDPNLIIGQFVIGGNIPDENGRPYIVSKNSTTRLQQKLDQDRSGGGSIQRATIKLVDKDQELTSLFSPGNQIPDTLGAKAKFFLNFSQAAHPEDSILLLSGFITNSKAGAGYWDITVSHPEYLKKQTLFNPITSELNGAINDSQTTITLDNTQGLKVSQDIISRYLRIDDEILEITNITGNDVDVIRGSRNTVASTHDDGAETNSAVGIAGDLIGIILKLLLSDGDEFYASQTASRFNQVSATLTVPNSIVFEGVDIETLYNLVEGDIVEISGADIPGNNITANITSFGTFPAGSYITIDQTLTTDLEQAATVNFKSQYYTLNEGAGLSPEEVDVPRFIELNQTLGTTFFNYDYYSEDEVNLKELIDEELLFPSRCFSIPRKGRISVNATELSLANADIKTVDSTTVLNPDKLVMDRSTNENFYNGIVYKVNHDPIQDKFLNVYITQNEDSQNRIKVGNQPLVIEAKGLKNDVDTINKIQINTERLLNRYKFAAESVKAIDVNYKTGFNLEVGDVVSYGDSALKLSDISIGSRNFNTRLMEVTNKNFNTTKGQIKIDLIDTKFGLDGRVGVISPASIVNTGSTDTRLFLKRNPSTPDNRLERYKWEDYFGELITVRSIDFSQSAQVTLLSYDPSNQDVLLIQQLPFTPSEGYVIEVPEYPNDANPSTNSIYKSLHCSINPQLVIVSGISGTSFTIDNADLDKIFVDSIVQIHSQDFSDNFETVVTDITGNTITVDQDMGFTPSAGYLIDLIGFNDLLPPYRVF